MTTYHDPWDDTDRDATEAEVLTMCLYTATWSDHDMAKHAAQFVANDWNRPIGLIATMTGWGLVDMTAVPSAPALATFRPKT